MRISSAFLLLLVGLPGVLAAGQPSLTVDWQGSLRAVHHGEASATITISDLGDLSGVSAVGPVADLDGEITLLDGQVFVTRLRDGELVTRADADAPAAFLVWARVDGWQDPVALGASLADHTELEQRVETLARSAGVDVSKPFPFRIEGVVDAMAWHVLSPLEPGHSDGHHLDAALKLKTEDEPVELIGFFSRSHQGVFTHRDAHAHIHVVTDDRHTGHVDAIALEEGATIRFPAID